MSVKLTLATGLFSPREMATHTSAYVLADDNINRVKPLHSLTSLLAYHIKISSDRYRCLLGLCFVCFSFYKPSFTGFLCIVKQLPPVGKKLEVQKKKHPKGQKNRLKHK